MSQETGVGKQRLSSHLRMLAALQNHIRKQWNTEHQVDYLALEPLLANLMRQLKRAARGRQLCISIETACALPVKRSTAFAIVLTELTANAVQHGSGTITITLRSLLGHQVGFNTLMCLNVSDEGDGFPTDFDMETHAMLGLEIVDVLCRWDLQGELILVNNLPSGGASATVYFPISSP